MVSQAPSFQKKAKKPEEKSQNALSTGLQARRRGAPYYWIVRPTSCKRQVDQTALKSNLTTSDPLLSSKPAEYIHSAMTKFSPGHILATCKHWLLHLICLYPNNSHPTNTRNPHHSHSQSLPPHPISSTSNHFTQPMWTNPKDKDAYQP